jgi:PKD repeat protein
VLNNTFRYNDGAAITLYDSAPNTIVTKNNFISNAYAGIELFHEFGPVGVNTIFLNNFIDNGLVATTSWTTAPELTYWNSTNSLEYTYHGQTYTNCMGNYYSDYSGNDADANGIGDTPYILPEDLGTDYAPLMEPWENYLGISSGDPGESAYSGGSGTEAAPYEINTAADLITLSTDSDNWDKYFIVTDDISLSAGSPTEPIGINASIPFNGSFDGQGYTISDFTMNKSDSSNVGLFGYLGADAEINDLRTEAGAEGVIGDTYVGILTGVSEGTITSCSATGNVTAGDSWAGGLVGLNLGSITGSFATGNASVAKNYAGGLAGDTKGTITNCYATGDVSGNLAGGLVGRGVDGATITNCYATGDASSKINAGGLVGGIGASGCTITNCYAIGEANAFVTNAGGLVGTFDTGTIVNCYRYTGGMSELGTLISDISLFKDYDFLTGTDDGNGLGWSADIISTDADSSKIWRVFADKSSYPIFQWQSVSDGGSATIAPVADFTTNVTIGRVPLTVQFTDNSTNSPTSWSWNFGDGNYSTEQNPVHTYTTAGYYRVILRVTNAAGYNSKSFYETVFIGPYSNAFENENEGASDPGVPGYVGPDGDGVPGGSYSIYPERNNSLNPIFKEWISSVVSYNPAPGVPSNWRNTSKCVGPVSGSNFDIISLGDLDQSQIDAGVLPGNATVTFDMPICNGDGPDFAAFENGFEQSGTRSLFAELGYVEVSTNGQDYARFPSVSLTPGLAGGYGGVDPTGVYNLVGKHANAYGSCWGTPFDLEDLKDDPAVASGRVDLNEINYVRIIDIPGSGDFKDSLGNPIYDAWVTWGSGGVDFAGIGVINCLSGAPVIDFTANTTSGNAPLTIQFTDTSANAIGWAWEFGDGETSDEQNPVHVYTTTGTYSVNLTVSNADGSNTTTKEDYITVFSSSSSSDDTWYQFMKNTQHTGYTGSDAPDTNTLLWRSSK